MTNQDYIKYLKNKVDLNLRLFFDDKLKEASKYDEEIVKIIKEIQVFTLRGGKRIRSILMILSFMGYSQDKNIKSERLIIKLSIIWELLQSFLLIHDDIIDNDDTRRGGPTVHVSLTKNGDRKVGESYAIMAGDMLIFWAQKLLSDELSADRLKATLPFLAEIIYKVIYGEILDIKPWSFNSSREKLNKQIEHIHYLKTATYTTIGPMILGAMIAGADKSQLKKLNLITTQLGLAFQIQDDILGSFGNKEKTGKSDKSDFEQGKLTHLVLDTVFSLNAKERINFMNQFGKKITDGDYKAIQQLMIDKKAYDSSIKLMNKYYDNGLKLLGKLQMDDKYLDILTFTIKYMSERSL